MEDKERYRKGERALAPLVATVVPALVAATLMVVTAVVKTPLLPPIEIVRVTDDPPVPPDPPDPPDPPEPAEQPPSVTPEIIIDMPTPMPSIELVPPQPLAVTREQTVVKPAAADAVSLIKSPIRMNTMSGLRNPGTIVRMTSGGPDYGDANTEAAVLKILRWLKHTQASEGSWANGGNKIANTGLAVLAFLAHGETPSSPEFGDCVMRAMQFLCDSLDDSGAVPKFRGADGNEYAFLIATYALCEAYGMTKNMNVKEAAEKALGRIVQNQGPTGGFDYRLNKESSRDDMSFEGWALQALKAGKLAGIHISGLEECIKKAIKCLKTRNFKNGGFGYTAGGNPTGLTATGCLCMQLLGYGADPEVKASLDYMREWTPTFGGKTEETPLKTPGPAWQYYCYYAAQCKYQAGMCDGATPANQTTWKEWNAAMKALYPGKITTLEETIEGPDGKPKKMGYIACGQDSLGMSNMKTLTSCLVALQLMVYYRYLPTTQSKAGRVENHGDNDVVQEDKPKKSDKKKPAPKKEEVDVEVDI